MVIHLTQIKIFELGSRYINWLQIVKTDKTIRAVKRNKKLNVKTNLKIKAKTD